MTNVEVRAVAQQETVIESFYREVFLKEGDCRFQLEVMSSDKIIRKYNLHAVGKVTAQKEASQLIQLMMKKFDDERMIWRVSGDSVWSITGASADQVVPKKKKETLLNRFVDFFFLTDEESIG